MAAIRSIAQQIATVLYGCCSGENRAGFSQHKADDTVRPSGHQLRAAVMGEQRRRLSGAAWRQRFARLDQQRQDVLGVFVHRRKTIAQKAAREVG
jgi:hypothetical protein